MTKYASQSGWLQQQKCALRGPGGSESNTKESARPSSPETLDRTFPCPFPALGGGSLSGLSRRCSCPSRVCASSLPTRTPIILDWHPPPGSYFNLITSARGRPHSQVLGLDLDICFGERDSIQARPGTESLHISSPGSGSQLWGCCGVQARKCPVQGLPGGLHSEHASLVRQAQRPAPARHRQALGETTSSPSRDRWGGGSRGAGRGKPRRKRLGGWGGRTRRQKLHSQRAQ